MKVLDHKAKNQKCDLSSFMKMQHMKFFTDFLNEVLAVQAKYWSQNEFFKVLGFYMKCTAVEFFLITFVDGS